MRERKQERQSADTCHIYTFLLPASPTGTRSPRQKTKQKTSTLTTSDQPSQPRKESRREGIGVGGGQKVRSKRGQGKKRKEE